MGFEEQAFDQNKAPLSGGLDTNEMITVQRMTKEGAALHTPVAPDMIWRIMLSNRSGPNLPPVLEADGTPLTGYLYAVVDVKLEGVTSCTVRPWFWNETLSAWIAGTSDRIRTSRRLKTRVDSAKSFYVEIADLVPSGQGDVKVSIAVAGTAD